MASDKTGSMKQQCGWSITMGPECVFTEGGPFESGSVIGLSDETKARLAHLEAIERQFAVLDRTVIPIEDVPKESKTMASLSDDLYLCRYVDPGGDEQCFFRFTGQRLPGDARERLDHLEAIESLQRKKEDEVCGFEYMVITDKIEALIRKGIEDNGKL